MHNKIIKKEVRVIGIDDAPFDRFKKTDVMVIGTIYRGGEFMDGMVTTRVRVDGKNSTKNITDMINECKFKPQLQAILLDGIAVAGFNVIDINELHENTGIPVIVVVRNYPNFKKIEKALSNLKTGNEKLELIKKAGDVIKLDKIHVQLAGISVGAAKRIIEITSTHSNVPEPIRISHIIASAITTGQSKGRA
ncbi:DUF99 family protein [Candidatus Woesearchaeota archaeon]|nr:DUF99 family protein [Candidatus Woesearchaeota archaeon]